MPATVTIPAGTAGAAFTVTADSAITKPETVTVTATLGTETLTQDIKVGPNAPLLSLCQTSMPFDFKGGYHTLGSISLLGTETQPVTVTVTSSDPRLVLPATLTVPAGGIAYLSGTTTGTLTSATTVTITAGWNGQSSTAQLTLTP